MQSILEMFGAITEEFSALQLEKVFSQWISFNEEIKSSLAVPMQYYDCNFPTTSFMIKKHMMTSMFKK